MPSEADKRLQEIEERVRALSERVTFRMRNYFIESSLPGHYDCRFCGEAVEASGLLDFKLLEHLEHDCRVRFH